MDNQQTWQKYPNVGILKSNDSNKFRDDITKNISTTENLKKNENYMKLRDESKTEKSESVVSNILDPLRSSKKRLSKTQDQAKCYLRQKNIYEILHFMMGHLLVDEPDQPIDFLAELLRKCIDFRMGKTKPPLLFTERHIESMFRSLDSAGLGNISLDQYKAGMTTLGLRNFNLRPEEIIPGRVNKETFVREAKQSLEIKLAELIG